LATAVQPKSSRNWGSDVNWGEAEQAQKKNRENDWETPISIAVPKNTNA